MKFLGNHHRFARNGFHGEMLGKRKFLGDKFLHVSYFTNKFLCTQKVNAMQLNLTAVE